jgi:transposase
MSRHSAMPSSEVEILAVQRRRRFSAEEKRRMVQETYQPGMTLSHVARAHGVSPSLLFRWRKLAGDGSLQAVAADESVVPASDYQEAQRQIRELQRLLGKKTQEAEILKEAMEIARAKKFLLRSP